MFHVHKQKFRFVLLVAVALSAIPVFTMSGTAQIGVVQPENSVQQGCASKPSGMVIREDKDSQGRVIARYAVRTGRDQVESKHGKCDEWSFDQSARYSHVEQWYFEGKRHGLMRSFDTLGRRVSELEYVDGLRHGYYRVWFVNGQLASEMLFCDDYEYGPFRDWFESGTLRTSGAYVNGKLDGRITEYYKNGKVKEESEFEQGVKSGVWRKFDEKGALVEEVEYKNGTVKEK